VLRDAACLMTHWVSRDFAPKKRMSRKRRRTRPKGRRRSVKCIPGDDCDSCLDWLLKNIDKAKRRGARVGQIARDQFWILLDDCIRRLFELALPEREKDTPAKEWAGRILARLHASLEAHQWKLTRENPAYRELKAKMKSRADVLVPESEISQMVQEELRTAESYQFRLLLLRDSLKTHPSRHLVSVDKSAVVERKRNELVWQLLPTGGWVRGTAKGRPPIHIFSDDGIKAIKKAARKAAQTLLDPNEVTQSISCTWQDVAQQKGIPKVYWSTVDLPRFCAASKDQWWEWLWSRILEDQRVLLPGRDPSKVRTQIHDHFLALVDAREDGTF